MQVLAHDENIGYEDLSNRVVIRLNGVDIRNIKQLAELVESSLQTPFLSHPHFSVLSFLFPSIATRILSPRRRGTHTACRLFAPFGRQIVSPAVPDVSL
jgi:hypothetical protein